MAASRRFYPGFFGALFLVALRIAIGWHFLYEGTQKILSTPEGKTSILARIFPVPDGPAFSSEGYLRSSTGPLAPRFRSLIPDTDSRMKLDPEHIKDRMTTEVDRVETHFGFSDEQKKLAGEVLQNRIKETEDWFQAVENRQRLKKYFDDVAEVEKIENNPAALSYERSNAWKDRKDIEADRKELVKMVDSWVDVLRDALLVIAKGDLKRLEASGHGPQDPLIVIAEADLKRFETAGPYKPAIEWGSIQKVDHLTMWGLSAVGLCLMLGLFTPLAALGGAAYLLGFYLSMPPWPGLEEGPKLEGHYLFVNKNLIEMLACLALAATPSGLWIGVDALLFGWIGRGRRRREQIQAEPTPIERPAPQDRRKFKNR